MTHPTSLFQLVRRASWLDIAVALALTLVAIVVLATAFGCNGVTLNATYSSLLDQTAALSAEDASRAQAGTLTPAQMSASLAGQANAWQMFKDARDGKASTPPAPATLTTNTTNTTNTATTQPN